MVMQRSDGSLEVFLAWVDRGAARAASAFSKLAGRAIGHESPKVAASDCDFPVSDAGDWSTGVFFRLEGCLDAWIGILFHQAASEAIVRRVVGISEGELSPHVIESALMEIGNILASHVASGISDEVGERLLPSIPTLAMNHAESEMAAFAALQSDVERIRIDSRIADQSGELSGLLSLLLVPQVSSLPRT